MIDASNIANKSNMFNELIEASIKLINEAKGVTIFTGAGISTESGNSTLGWDPSGRGSGPAHSQISGSGPTKSLGTPSALTQTLEGVLTVMASAEGVAILILGVSFHFSLASRRFCPYSSTS
jgi:hypothetical protein